MWIAKNAELFFLTFKGTFFYISRLFIFKLSVPEKFGFANTKPNYLFAKCFFLRSVTVVVVVVDVVKVLSNLHVRSDRGCCW